MEISELSQLILASMTSDSPTSEYFKATSVVESDPLQAIRSINMEKIEALNKFSRKNIKVILIIILIIFQ
jgi:hypothetical protein